MATTVDQANLESAAKNCLWGGVCSRGDVYNGCIEHVFGYGIEPFIALEGASPANQQWIVRRGVVGSTLFE